jgi:hypothetical protein
LYPVTIASLGKEVLMLMILLAFNVDVHSFKMLGALVLIDFPVTLFAMISSFVISTRTTQIANVC